MRLSAPVHQLKRRAKLLARTENIAMHKALDRIARAEGFATWSLLSARALPASATRLLPGLAHGDFVLLAARPGHGKTLLGIRLLLDALDAGRRGVFYTLEYSSREVVERVRSLSGSSPGVVGAMEIVTSADISAGYITHHLSDAQAGTVAVVDYLQILDQRRDKPPLAEQMDALRAFARRSGTILVFISQIDRSFDPAAKPVPDMADIRLPNPIDMGMFSKACFLHDGRMQVHEIA